MRIESIQIKNWLPFAGTATIDLPSGPIAVVGAYADNPRRSNWSGKTAFLEAIEWCFFGTHRKRYEDGVIHGMEPDAAVKITLTGSVIVERRRRRGKPTRLRVTEGDEVFEKKEAQRRVIEILGFDGDDFDATVCFSQGDTAAIVDRTSSERRKVVGQWLELEAWLRVASRVRVHSKEVTAELKEIRARLDVHRDAIGSFEPDTNAEMIGRTAGQIFRMRDAIAEIDLALEAHAADEIRRLDSERLEKKIEHAREVKEEIKGLDPKEIRRRLPVLRETAETADTARVIAQREFEDARSLKRDGFDGVCPVMREECPARDVVTSKRDAAAERYEEARLAAKEAAQKADTARRELRGMETAERRLERIREDYVRTVETIKELKESINALEETGDLPDPGILRRTKADLRERIRPVRKEFNRALLDAESHHSDLTAADLLEADLDVAEERSAAAAMALRCVGPTGIPARIAESSLAHLEEQANELLSGTGLSFEFAWDRETKDPVTACFECGYSYRGKKDKACPACGADRPLKRADELEILVNDGSGVIEDVKAKSGGAKVLVGSSIRLAAGLMLREMRGSTFAVALVDEPFGALDSENRESLARTFAGMLGAVGLEQAFVVSHDTKLLDALPHRIVVFRDGEASTLRTE